MNQKTLQFIYKTYQTKEYFKRYLIEQGCREDRRTPEQHRPIKITARNNSVVISVGHTLIIAHVQTQLQTVTFSPLTLSYGQPLLKLQVVSSLQAKYRESKPDRAIQDFISRQINWAAVEDELVGSDIGTGKQYAYKGNLTVRILGEDGGVQQYTLLAVQILLWTCKFKKFTINKEKIQYGEDYKLQLHQFLFPFKYCYVLDRTLVDPSQSEEQNCQMAVSVIKDISDLSLPLLVTHHSRKDFGKVSDTLLKQILGTWQSENKAVTGEFQTMLMELEERKEFILYKQN